MAIEGTVEEKMCMEEKNWIHKRHCSEREMWKAGRGEEINKGDKANKSLQASLETDARRIKSML